MTLDNLHIENNTGNGKLRQFSLVASVFFYLLSVFFIGGGYG
jgi:nitrate reductase NapE component